MHGSPVFEGFGVDAMKKSSRSGSKEKEKKKVDPRQKDIS
jgi:hypothetical protein